MKLFSSDDNAVKIGGKRVPYSLLGAAAAILGAFLIWKFNQAGGLHLGQASPDLSGLTDVLGGSGGGGAGVDLGTSSANDLLGTGSSIPIYSGYSYGAPMVYGSPVYASAPVGPAPSGGPIATFNPYSSIAAAAPIGAPNISTRMTYAPPAPAPTPVGTAVASVGGYLAASATKAAVAAGAFAKNPPSAPVSTTPTPSASGRSL
jgi:hypothetical protein